MTLPAAPATASAGVAPTGPQTPKEWLDVLTRRMDLRRLTVLMMKSYVDGNRRYPKCQRTQGNHGQLSSVGLERIGAS
jgi:hypothetical protein